MNHAGNRKERATSLPYHILYKASGVLCHIPTKLQLIGFQYRDQPDRRPMGFCAQANAGREFRIACSAALAGETIDQYIDDSTITTEVDGKMPKEPGAII